MPKITFISHQGEAWSVNVEKGLSLMRGALNHGVPGIDADCGGSCVCGTCRVMVDAAWRGVVGGPSDVEEMIIEMSPEPLEGARLSCQIEVTDGLDGLIVTLPEEQFR